MPANNHIGLYKITARFHPDQSRRKITQNSRSEAASLAEDAFSSRHRVVAAAPGFQD